MLLSLLEIKNNDKNQVDCGGGGPRGVMVKTLDCRIVVRVFELQSCSLSENYEPPYPPSYGLNSITTVLQEACIWH